MVSEWRPANNGNGKRRWFVYRDHPEIMQRYLWGEGGALIKFASCDAARKRAQKLNEVMR